MRFFAIKQKSYLIFHSLLSSNTTPMTIKMTIVMAMPKRVPPIKKIKGAKLEYRLVLHSIFKKIGLSGRPSTMILRWDIRGWKEGMEGGKKGEFCAASCFKKYQTLITRVKRSHVTHLTLLFQKFNGWPVNRPVKTRQQKTTNSRNKKSITDW